MTKKLPEPCQHKNINLKRVEISNKSEDIVDTAATLFANLFWQQYLSEKRSNNKMHDNHSHSEEPMIH